MADERQFGTQELISAKYLVQTEESTQPEVEAPRAASSRADRGLKTQSVGSRRS